MNKKPQIVFITDDRISKEKAAILSEKVGQLKKHFNIEVIRGQDFTEQQMLQALEKTKYLLVIAPIHLYQAWNKVEGFFGINRTSGPTFVGYLSEPLPRFKSESSVGRARKIILDFKNLSSIELTVLIRSLIDDTQRSGLKPLLDPNTLIYCENWYGNQGQGTRIDHLLSLPEIQKHQWTKRSNPIRILLSAFWSLIYDEGPGKAELPLSSLSTKPRAYFQVAADSQVLLLRLHFSYGSMLHPKDAIQKFSPDRTCPLNPCQLLLSYSDFLRVHTIHETSEIEIVVGLFQSASSEKLHDEARTLWIEPLSAQLIQEAPFTSPGPRFPELRAFPGSTSGDTPKESKLRLVTQDNVEEAKVKSQPEPPMQIKKLQERIHQQEKTIRELKSGGVGTAPQLPPPDAEDLLEAFQQRYFEVKYQIRQLELAIETLENKGGSPEEIHDIHLRIEALMNREQSWIKKLIQMLDFYKKYRKIR